MPCIKARISTLSGITWRSLLFYSAGVFCLILPASANEGRILLPHSYNADQQPANVIISPDQYLINQQQRQRALQQSVTPQSPDVRLSQPGGRSKYLRFPQETRCFMLSEVKISGVDTLPFWLHLNHISRQANGHCLGVQGISLLMSTLQNRLVDAGYITTRVLAPAQDLNSGKLELLLVPGKIRQTKLTAGSGHYVSLYTAFPAHSGGLLDLRDIEQGLENLQRLPTVKANVEILPGQQPGESDIVLNWQQQRMWRAGVSLDDAGSRSTGRYQGGLTLSVDNPFTLSDLFYLSGNRSLSNNSANGSSNITGHYSVPLGYSLLSITGSSYDYHLTAAGMNSDICYSGKSSSLGVQLSHVLHRSGNQKTTLTYDVLMRQSGNKTDDVEIEVQRRLVSAWRIGLDNRHFFPFGTLDTGISYQQGTRWFGAIPAPEESAGDATALSRIVQLTAKFAMPFEVAKTKFRYNMQYKRQLSSTWLTPQDQFAIGNRWTVRGFDGERTLNADSGWHLSNELAWILPQAQAEELYLGGDYGEVGGHGAKNLLGRRLAGGAIGLRGRRWGMGYDLFTAMPFSKPDGFSTDPWTMGFTVNWQY